MSAAVRMFVGEMLRELTPVARQYVMIGLEEKQRSKVYELEKQRMSEQLEVVKSVTLAPAQSAPQLSTTERHTDSIEQRFRSALEESSPMKVVGRATWNDYHRRAASFPPSPTPEQEQRFKEYIISSVASLPCAECAQHGLAYIEANPIDTSSRAAIKAWICGFHNATNARLGKPTFDCATL